MKKKDILAVVLVLAALVIVFFDLFTLKSAFLSGDHRDQQYPWAKFYQQEIREGRLPWWTSQIQSGFPLLAEGQIGAFYPLNFLFFYFLPVKFAYNYIVLFQYLLGALLFYFYLRRSGLLQWPALFSTLIYLFGSTQGGYFYYNYISQKVVIWLPLTLLLLDRLLEKQKFRDALFLSIVFAVQIFGGYLQIAVYSMFYSSLYFLFFWFRERRAKTLLLYAAACGLGIFFSLVQLFPTYHLSLLSSRASAAKEIAYIGSMNPLGLITLWMPAWDGFVGSEYYLGLLGLFFFLFAFRVEKTPKRNFFIFACFFFLLLALGKWGGIYAAAIELTQFYAFRTPIKFLFFSAFSAAILAGYGFQNFFERSETGEKISKTGKCFLLPSVLLTLSIPFLSFVLFRLRDKLLPALTDYVLNHIHGRPGHPYSADIYREKAQQFYDGFGQMVSLLNHTTRLEWAFLAAAVVFVLLMLRTRDRRVWKPLCFLFLFIDLFFYGFTSIRSNFEPYTSIDSPQIKSGIVDFLKKEAEPFRVMEVYTETSETGRYPVFPNSNMLLGIDDLGAYSPLVMRDYTRFLKGWGYTNDSLAMHWVQPEKVVEHLPELGFMNVKYLLSLKPLEHPALPRIMEEKGIALYQNQKAAGRAFFIPNARSLDRLDSISDAMPVSLKIENQQSLEIHFEAPGKGLLFVSQIHTPEWKAWLNGNPVPLIKAAGLFQAVQVEKGRAEIRLAYQPRFYQSLGIAAIIVLLMLLVFCHFEDVRSTDEKSRVHEISRPEASK